MSVDPMNKLNKLIDYPLSREGSCPNCGKKLDAALGAGGRPRKGDVMICIACSHIAIWDRGRCRNPNDEEMVEIAGHPEMVEMVRVLALAKAEYEAGHPGKRWEDQER